MGHQDKGHFAAKHKGKIIIETIAQKLRAGAKDNNITCSMAHQTAVTLNTAPLEIGVQIDLLEFRISECQMGLFGYDDGQKKFDPDIEVSPELARQLDKISINGRISCKDCWDIAKSLKVKRLDIGSACEKKNIRIKPCQLGAF